MEFIKDKNRFYQVDKEGKLIAEITYELIDEDTVEANHTFVDESLRGQGVAEQLVERFVKEMEEKNKKIHPTCEYIVALFKRKKEKYGHIKKIF